MIYTITLNPALDVSGIVDEVIPNEKCYVDEEVYFPGGNGINAGIIAARLGAQVKLTGFLGGPFAKIIKDLLKKENIKNNFYSISNHTRMNITVSSRKTLQQTRLSFNGPEIKSYEWAKFLPYFLKR